MGNGKLISSLISISSFFKSESANFVARVNDIVYHGVILIRVDKSRGFCCKYTVNDKRYETLLASTSIQNLNIVHVWVA